MNTDQSREDAYIDAIVAAAPPFTPGQIARLSALFDQEQAENQAEKPPGRRKRRLPGKDTAGPQSTPIDHLQAIG